MATGGKVETVAPQWPIRLGELVFDSQTNDKNAVVQLSVLINIYCGRFYKQKSFLLGVRFCRPSNLIAIQNNARIGANLTINLRLPNGVADAP